MLAVSENFDLLDQELTHTDYYNTQKHRNLVAEFYSINENRIAQYRATILKARETLEVIRKELDK